MLRPARGGLTRALTRSRAYRPCSPWPWPPGVCDLLLLLLLVCPLGVRPTPLLLLLLLSRLLYRRGGLTIDRTNRDGTPDEKLRGDRGPRGPRGAPPPPPAAPVAFFLELPGRISASICSSSLSPVAPQPPTPPASSASAWAISWLLGEPPPPPRPSLIAARLAPARMPASAGCGLRDGVAGAVLTNCA